MPGESADDALAAAERLATRGLGTILTQLGENLTSLGDAAQVRDHYIALLDRIAGRGVPALPSVKPTQLGLDLSPEACFEHTRAIVERAEAAGSFVWVDMEDSSYVDRTLDLFRKLRERHERVGLCLQAYLRRTPADLESLMPLKPAIRLVKGAYAEAPHVAFPAKRDVDLAYYDLARRLLDAAATGGAFPVFGTHDMPLVARLADHATRAGVRADAWEIHMLYGIRTGDQESLAARGRVVRTLISYGRSWFPWYMRRLAERPANVWFVVKSLAG